MGQRTGETQAKNTHGAKCEFYLHVKRLWYSYFDKPSYLSNRGVVQKATARLSQFKLLSPLSLSLPQ